MSKTSTVTFNLLATQSPVIEFNPLWTSNTSQFKHAVDGDCAPILEQSEVVRSVDPRGRRIVIIGYSEKSNLVFFERYTPVEHKHLIDANLSAVSDKALVRDHDIDLHCMVKENTLRKVCELLINKTTFSFNNKSSSHTYLFDLL